MEFELPAESRRTHRASDRRSNVPHARRDIVRRLTSAMGWSVVVIGLFVAGGRLAEAGATSVQGNWTAVEAERDGKRADDVIGNRLSFSDDRFAIVAQDGTPLYAGTFRLDPTAKPAAIDFRHADGDLKGKAWEGIYALAGDRLTIADNAPNLEMGRPTAFEAKNDSGYVVITFERTKP